MTWPDFPMTPPMRDAWQRSRNAAWPGGTESGGGGCLERLEDPFAGYGVGSGMEALVVVVVVDPYSVGFGRFAGGERKVLPII